MKYLILFTLLLSLVSCSKKQVSPSANMTVHISGVAPMNFSVTVLTNDGNIQTTLYNIKLTTETYDYAFYANPGSDLKFDLLGPDNVPLSINVKYNGTVVATESNVNFPTVNVVSLGYIVSN